MSFPETPSLLLTALAPGVLALALGACLLAKGWVRALGATLASVGLALGSLVAQVAVAFGLAGLYWIGGFVLMQSACSFHSGGC